MNAQTKRLIILYHSRGTSLRKIAGEVGYSHTQVSNLLQKVGSKTTRYTWPRAAYNKTLYLREKRWSYRRIAEYLIENGYINGYGRNTWCYNTVWRLIKKGNPNE